eukprot:TRINITY_DN37301_c0_g1_i1.p1 TRINITY_DN37301_c0_g1~~TRINITY_DN37301_c0_g1_i1.p1  ORF type:complete len:409 (+),score=77.23 TRINITY_DN37301_c0_g1_i1:68-1294(+)
MESPELSIYEVGIRDVVPVSQRDVLALKKEVAALRIQCNEESRIAEGVFGAFEAYFAETAGKIIERISSETKKSILKGKAASPPPPPRCTLNGLRHTKSDYLWPSTLNRSIQSDTSFSSQKVEVQRESTVTVVGVVNVSSPIAKLTPPTGCVQIERGRELREFQLDHAISLSRSYEQEMSLMRQKLQQNTDLCITLASDSVTKGQQYSIDILSKLVSLLIGTRTLTLRAFVTDGDRFIDIVDGGNKLRNRQVCWKPFDLKKTSRSLDTLTQVPLQDSCSAAQRINLLGGMRQKQRSGIMVVLLQTSSMLVSVIDLNCKSDAHGRNSQQRTAYQSVFDVLSAIRSEREHLPTRNSKLTAQLSDISFAPKTHHILLLGVCYLPDDTTSESHAVRMLHLGSRVCGNQYLLK